MTLGRYELAKQLLLICNIRKAPSLYVHMDTPWWAQLQVNMTLHICWPRGSYEVITSSKVSFISNVYEFQAEHNVEQRLMTHKYIVVKTKDNVSSIPGLYSNTVETLLERN